MNPTSLMVIAEAATCHGGDITRAMELVELAASAGADAIKFQHIHPELLYSPRITVGGSIVDNPSIAQRRSELLSDEELKRLRNHAETCGIDFLLTIFDLQSVNLIEALGLDTIKIASGDLTFLPLVKAVLGSDAHVLLSTGMSSVAEVEQVVMECHDQVEDNLTLLHCTSVYPCPPALANLERIGKLRGLGLPVGYSDHTLGSWASCAAVALGATVLEKHIRLTFGPRTADFDHSMTEDEFGSFVSSVKNVRLAVTASPENLSDEELVVKSRARRGLYARTNLKAGKVISLDDVDFLRPPTDINPMSSNEIIGMRIASDVLRGDPILRSNLRE